jgi:hypothetical protein
MRGGVGFWGRREAVVFVKKVVQADSKHKQDSEGVSPNQSF